MSQAVEPVSHNTSKFERADVATIKQHTRQILSNPDFSPKKTFWQWLSEKFSKWKRPKFDFGRGWAGFIFSFIFFWCVLTLIAIFIHLLWTIGLFLRSNAHSPGTLKALDKKTIIMTSAEELYKMAREMAEKGAFREAISIMIVALLRWLDSRGIVRFHESKTNGDYIREYPSDYAGRAEFKAFVLMFEQTVYGGLQSDGSIYSKMNSLMEHIHNCADQRT